MIKAVIFDCFGVLTTDGWKQIREEHFSHDPEKMQHSIDIDRAVNAGFLSYDDFLDEISKLTGISLSEIKKRMNGNAPNIMLFDFIKSYLKPRFKIGMLSNAADNWLNQLFVPWQVALFESVTLSYQTGTVKPDPAIYQAAIDNLGIDFNEAIFIDDSERYVQAAEQLGIRGIHHTDTPSTIAKIQELISA